MWSQGDTVTVLRARPRDRFGDGGFDVHHTESNVAIAPTGTAEPDPLRGLVESDVDLYLPPGADVLASDRIELPDGDEYFVVGKPARWKSPFTGWKPGVVVQLKAAV